MVVKKKEILAGKVVMVVKLLQSPENSVILIRISYTPQFVVVSSDTILRSKEFMREVIKGK